MSPVTDDDMVIIVFDRMKDTGTGLTEMLGRIYGGVDSSDYHVHYLTSEEELMSYCEGHIFHVVFICMSQSCEKDLRAAKVLMRLIPGVNIILVSGDESYMSHALRLHASGYICLPLSEDKVGSELSNLLYPVYESLPEIRMEPDRSRKIYVEGRPVNFTYEKTNELFMMLFDLGGGMMSTGEMIDGLWEEGKDISRSRSYLQNIRSDLLHTLSLYGLDGAVKHRRGRMWIDMNRFRISNAT